MSNRGEVRKPALFLFSLVLPALVLWAFPSLSRLHAQGTTERAKDEQSIRQLNEECLKAHDAADVATLDRIEDADFTVAGDFGVVTKQQQLEKVRQRSTKSEVITRKIEPQHFRFYGDIALVTETDRPTTKDGTFAYQSTEVWVRRCNEWKLAHLHYSQLDEKQ